ncbi:MAG: phosphocholine cytidylyltransferase family protein [bacterium]|nr:phosphocholine cytidylyltransferase family protein [bacterium]
MIKQAIILAAGQGKRLLPYTKDRPKCLIEIGGKTVLEHQVEALQAQGVDKVTVVVGYLGGKVREVLGARSQYIENTRYTTTSSMYSLWLAREAATDGCIILNSDVLFHVGILQALLDSPHADALAVDFDAVLAEEETKVLVTGNRVQALSKALLRGDGENVGMLKFSAAGGQVLFGKIQQLLDQGYHLEMVPFAVNALASNYAVAAISVQGLPWLEIDFPEDYQRACDVIYPAICRAPYTLMPPHHKPLARVRQEDR